MVMSSHDDESKAHWDLLKEDLVDAVDYVGDTDFMGQMGLLLPLLLVKTTHVVSKIHSQNVVQPIC